MVEPSTDQPSTARASMVGEHAYGNRARTSLGKTRAHRGASVSTRASLLRRVLHFRPLGLSPHGSRPTLFRERLSGLPIPASSAGAQEDIQRSYTRRESCSVQNAPTDAR